VDDTYLTINGDSAAKYSYLTISASNTSGSLTAPADFTTFAATAIPLLRMAASQAGSAVNMGMGIAFIPWYTLTNYNKGVIALSGAGNGTSSLADGRLRWGWYNPASQAAITSLALAAAPGSNYLTGSSFGLYGLT
jgi:hypothetical protein